MSSSMKPTAAGILGLVGAALALRALHPFLPVERWQAWLLAQEVAWALLFHGAAAASGLALLDRLRLGRRPAAWRLAVAGPLGVLGYVAVVWLTGAARLLTGPVVLLWAAGSLWLGRRSLRRAWRTLARRTAAGIARAPTRALALHGFGLAMASWLWLGVLSPGSVNYDAAWNHLVIAQEYARQGRIVSFPGDWVKNLPHLGSLVNTWAFLVPGLPHEPSRWVQALQLEFGALAWTLLGVGAVVGRVHRHRAPSGVWGLFALFPGLWVYDFNLGAAADHYTALFAAPALLGFLEWLRRPSGRFALITGLFLGAACATKVQGLFMLLPMAALAGGMLLRRALAGRGLDLRRAVLPAAAGLVVPLGPHLLRNTLFFHNPAYPLLQGLLGGVPSVPEAAQQVAYLFADWSTHPPAEPGARLAGALQRWVSFGFEAHYSFIGGLPGHGFLFPMLTVALLFLPRSPALWTSVALAHGGILVWASTVWVDRNLQVFAPWVWAASIALLVGLWRLGGLARLGVAALVTVELAWNVGLHGTSLDRTMQGLELFRSQLARGAPAFGHEHRLAYRELSAALPEDAVVVLHLDHTMLGLRRPVLLDWIGFQGLIDFRPLRSEADVVAAYRAAGATHLVWRPNLRPAASKQEELLFALVARRAEPHLRRFGELALVPLAALAPLDDAPLQVVMLGFPGYQPGRYPVTALSTCERYPPHLQVYAAPAVQGDQPELAALAQVVMAAPNHALSAAWAALLQAEFEAPLSTPGGTVWRRRPR